MVSEEGERASLEDVAEVERRGVDGQELTVEGGVALLGWGEFWGEKSKRLPLV